MRHGGPVEALIFDMDGTMIDSIPVHKRAWSAFATRHGIALDVDAFLQRINGRTGTECNEALFGRPFSDEEALRLTNEKEAIYRDLMAHDFRAMPGVRRLVADAAAQGLKIGVGSAGDRHNLAFAFEHLALAPAPGAVVGGDEGLPGKPNPAIFLEVARRLGVAPEHCVVFEDAPFGIEAARRAGMRAVAICSSHSADELAGEHVMAATVDFERLLESQFLDRLPFAKPPQLSCMKVLLESQPLLDEPVTDWIREERDCR